MAIATQFKKLTERSVKEAQPDPAGYYFVRDTQLKGFALRVYQSGAKSFIADSTVTGSRTRRKITVGKWPRDKVSDARELAAEALRQMARGIDPVEHRKSETAAKAATQAHERLASTTLRDVLERHLKRGLRAATEKQYRKDIEREFANWLDEPVRDITRQACEDWWLAGSQGVAKSRVRRELTAVLNTATRMQVPGSDEPLLAKNPMDVIREARHKVKVTSDKTHLYVGNGLDDWVHTVMALPEKLIRAYLLFMVCTGCRVKEVDTLKWRDVDLVARTVTLKDTKSGRPHEIPMSAGMVVLLRSLFDNHKNPTELVFPIKNIRKWVKWIRNNCDPDYRNNKAFKLKWLRNTFAHLMTNGVDCTEEEVQRMMSHSASTVTAKHYVDFDMNKLREKYDELTIWVLQTTKVLNPTRKLIADDAGAVEEDWDWSR